MTDEAGKVMVFTREGASDRKNGIVIATLDDPLHPKVVAEFTEGVTAGVHSAFIYTQPKYGTHVYLTNDGTGAIHIDRHQRPGPSQAGRHCGRRRGRTRAGTARHRRAGRAALRQLLERRAGDPRRRQGDQGRQPLEAASWSRSTSTTSTRSTGRSPSTAGPGSSAGRTPRGGTGTTSSSATRCSATSRRPALFAGAADPRPTAGSTWST